MTRNGGKGKKKKEGGTGNDGGACLQGKNEVDRTGAWSTIAGNEATKE